MKSDIATLPISLDIRRQGVLLEQACLRIAAAPVRGVAIAQEVQRLAGMGVNTSFKSLERVFYKWKKVGAIACIDKRKVYGQTTGRGIHQPRFRAYWVNLAASFGRSSKAAYDELVKRWRNSEPIPGYEREWNRVGALPKGWSYENLMRLLPGKAELGIYRQGLTQAAACVPQVLSTRAGSYPLQFVFIDDVWLDRICRHGAEVNRAFELGALDFCTGMRLSVGMKFRHKRKDGRHVYFEHDDMLLLLAALLRNDGYNAQRGTTLVVENGTASISPEVEEMLSSLTGGMVRVDRSGRIGARQLLKGYGGRVMGNPRHKAPLESWHSAFHNRLCCGGADWTGKDRRPPETVAGIMAAEKQHLKNMADLPIERAQFSIGHVLTFAELAQECARVTGEMNRREDHHLEGWSNLGFVSAEWTQDPASGMWGDMDAIADNAAMMSYVAGLPASHRRLRRWSPLEAWNRSTAKLENQPTRFTDMQVAILLSMGKGENLCRRVTPYGGVFRWRNSSYWADVEEYTFETRYTGADGYQHEVPPDAKGLRGVLNPVDPFVLFIFDENGVPLGSCAQVNRVRRDDFAAVQAAMGRKAQRTADVLQPMRNLMEPTEAERLDRIEWNRRVADYNEGSGEGAPLTIAEVVEQREDKRAMAAALRVVTHHSTVGQFTLPEPAEDSLPQQYAPSSFNQ